MRNKTGIVLLTIIITSLCIFYLSFTFISRNIERKAKRYAKDDFQKQQNYLDSVWNKEVYFGFTFGEIKAYELNLGLDLQGGMHVVLEISPAEILVALADNSPYPAFKEALSMAQIQQRNSQKEFTELFFQNYQKTTSDTGQLATIFANRSNQGRINFNATNEEIEAIIQEEIDDAVDRAYQIIQTRINKFGVTQPNIQRIQGTSRIQLELPGVDNPERVRRLLQGVAKLEFLEMYPIQEAFSSLQRVDQYLVSKEKSQLTDSFSGTADSSLIGEEENLFVESTSEISDSALLLSDSSDNDSLEDSLNASSTEVSPLFSRLRSRDIGSNKFVYDMQDTSLINDIFSQKEVRNLLPQSMQPLWGVKPIQNAQKELTSYIQLYLVKKGREGAPLTGEKIIDARQSFDEVGRPSVTMQMNTEGARVWRKLTRQNINRSIAIVLDNSVYSAPVVQNEISGGSSSINGSFSVDEAKDLANILKAGKLPAPTRIVEETVIGPSLGVKAQRQGIISIVSGLILVVLFMLLYYSKGGIVANIALLINIFFIVGIIAQLQAALTLPGIAGIVLTIGMSIDANVLIFERIREELENGYNLLQSIKEGYNRAFQTIFDANLTTLLTAIFLFLFGSGPVRGFGTTLIVGIACSFFSSVFITRVIIEYMTRKGNKSQLAFSSGFAQNISKKFNFQFLKKRKIAYVFSSGLILIGIIIISIKGLNLGVDFKGGRSYTIAFDHTIIPSDLKLGLTESFEGKGVEVKTFGSDNIVKITTSYLVDDESDTADIKVRATLIEGLSKITGNHYQPNEEKIQPNEFAIASTSKVGATIADDIADSSRSAVLFSLLAVFVYILIRFRKLGFGIGALIALFHDTLVVLSMFAIAQLLGFHFEVDQVFIAAMLTIIGYSINDTVVVFDRVREYSKQYAKKDFGTLLNSAINSTLNRTLITSFHYSSSSNCSIYSGRRNLTWIFICPSGRYHFWYLFICVHCYPYSVRYPKLDKNKR